MKRRTMAAGKNGGYLVLALTAAWSLGGLTGEGLAGADQSNEITGPLSRESMAKASAERTAERPLVRAQPAVQFELADDSAAQRVAPTTGRVELIVRLVGEPRNEEEQGIVAIFEGPGIVRALVPFEFREQERDLEAILSLELPDVPPMGSGAESSLRVERPVMIRLMVTFAKVQGMAVHPFGKRNVYLTVSAGGSSADRGRAESRNSPNASIDTASTLAAPTAGLKPVFKLKEQEVVEKDLVVSPVQTKEMQTYWREINQRITQRWGERTRAVWRGKPVRYPRVQFRLYPNGIAQTIYVERSSGDQQVDEAGLESVVDMQPFEPFPTATGEPYITVHVDFRSEARKRN
jgi:hypothetical protein